MNKNLRKRKIKALMKIAIPLDIYRDPEIGPQAIQYLSNEIRSNEISLESICDWNDSIVLDLLGVVPGFGDALDLGRSFVFLNCGKMLDAVIGLICVIPVYGSAIGLSLKALMASGKITKLKDVIFYAVDFAKKYFKELKESDLILEIIADIKMATSHIDEFFDGVLKSKYKFFETEIDIKNNINNFKQYIENYDEVGIEAYQKWKNRIITEAKFAPDIVNFPSIRAHAGRYFSSRSLNIFSQLMVDFFELGYDLIKLGYDAIFQRIKNGFLNANLAHNKRSLEIINAEFDAINNMQDLKRKADKYFGEGELDLFFEHAEGIGDAKNSLKELIKEFSEESSEEAIKKFTGISKSIAKSTSRNFDLFYSHIKSDSYMEMLRLIIEKYGNKNVTKQKISSLIDEFLEYGSSLRFVIIDQKTMDLVSNSIEIGKDSSVRGLSHYYDDLVNVVDGHLEDSVILSHELLHNFDLKFGKFLISKNMIKSLPMGYISDALANFLNPLLISIKDSQLLLSKVGVHFKGGIGEAQEFIGYWTKPTEMLSFFNDVRSRMILTGNYSSYPKIEEVLEYIIKNEHDGFAIMVKSIKEISDDLGEKAYSELKTRRITGDFFVDFFKQFGL